MKFVIKISKKKKKGIVVRSFKLGQLIEDSE